MAVDGRGDEGEKVEGLSILQQASRDGQLFQIFGADLDGGRRLLAGCDREPLEGTDELGTADKDTGTGGRQPMGIRGVFKGGVTGGPHIWVVDVGGDPLHGHSPGGGSTQSPL